MLKEKNKTNITAENFFLHMLFFIILWSEVLENR